MTSTFFNRRMLMGRLAAGLSAVGWGACCPQALKPKNRDSGVRKLGRDGKPADGTQMITASHHAQRSALHCRTGSQLEWAGGKGRH